MKKYELAIINYSKALEINPNYANAFYNRGFCYANLKKHELAITDYNKAIEILNGISISDEYKKYLASFAQRAVDRIK